MFYQVDPYDIVGILIETLLYGVFLALFAISTILLLQRRKVMLSTAAGSKAKVKNLTLYLVLSTLMFCTISAKWSFYWPEVLPILGHEQNPIQVPRLSRTSYRFKEACIQATVLIGDSITIHRLWILSGRSKLMVTLPILGFFAFFVCAIVLSGPFNDTTKTPIPIERNGEIALTRWDAAAASITLGITVYVTVMISWIIFRAQSHVGVRLGGYGLKKTLAVIVESAAIAATWNLLFLIAGLGFKSQITLCLLDSIPAVYGVSAMLINVRIGLGLARGAGGEVAGAMGGEPSNYEVCLSTMVFGTQYIGANRGFTSLSEGGSIVSSVTVTGRRCP